MNYRNTPLLGFLPCAVLLAATLIPTADATADTEIESLRRQIEQLQLAVERLEKQKAKEVKVTAGAGGLRVDAPERAFSFRVNGLVQFDARLYPGSRSSGSDSFDLRRVRPTLQGALGEDLEFRFTPELSGTVRILDAYGDFRFARNSSLRFGNFKTPVGLERLQGAANLLFNERGFATEFTPARDLGVQIQSRFLDGLLTTKVGLFNGATDGANGAPSPTTGGFSGAGSIFLEPFKEDGASALRGLGLGIAGSYGRREGGAGFRVRGTNRLDVSANSNIREDGAHYRLNPSLYFYRGSFGILGEYILSSRELFLAGGAPQRYRSSGWTLSGSYILTGEKRSYGRVVPSHPVKRFGGEGWGAWEVALRYSGTSLDSRLFTDGLLNSQQSKAAHACGLGLNWYLSENLRALFSFERTRFERGPGGSSRSGENAILTRLQVSF